MSAACLSISDTLKRSGCHSVFWLATIAVAHCKPAPAVHAQQGVFDLLRQAPSPRSEVRLSFGILVGSHSGTCATGGVQLPALRVVLSTFRFSLASRLVCCLVPVQQWASSNNHCSLQVFTWLIFVLNCFQANHILLAIPAVFRLPSDTMCSSRHSSGTLQLAPALRAKQGVFDYSNRLPSRLCSQLAPRYYAWQPFVYLRNRWCSVALSSI